AHNRLRQVYSADKDSREDLIAPLMEQYRAIYNSLYNSLPNDLKAKMIKQTSSEINSMVSLYSNLESDSARRAIRASIDKVQEGNWGLFDDPKFAEGITVLAETKDDLARGCYFLGQEAVSGNLNNAESAILEE